MEPDKEIEAELEAFEAAFRRDGLPMLTEDYSPAYDIFTRAVPLLGLVLLLEIILSGWRHGRRSPQLLGIVWPEVWNEPTETVRNRLGVAPYQAPVAPDLVEELERGADRSHREDGRVRHRPGVGRALR